MSIQAVSAKPLDIGEVLSDTFAVIGRNIVLLANIAVMFIAIPAVVRIAGVVLAPASPLFGILTFIGTLAGGVGALLAYASIFQLTMADLHGQTVTTDVMFRTAARKFWPMLGLALLLGLGIFAGCLLLLVPGVILAMAWSAALPALVLENRGVFEAFGRSAALTRKRRWSIFLLSFLVGIVVLVAETVLFAIFGGFNGIVSGHANAASTVLSSLLSVVTVPFGAVMNTTLFDHLRGKEGYGAEAVAEVFA